MPKDRRQKYALGGYSTLPPRMAPPSNLPPRMAPSSGGLPMGPGVKGVAHLPRGGALASSMQQQQGLQQQRGRLPGGDPRAMAMQRFQASRGMRPPAPGGARPIAPQVQPGMPRGTFNPGPNIPHQVPPPDRRVIPGPSQGNYGPRLRQMNANMRPRGRYAKGGKVKRAVAALERARGMLHDSDPDFDHIADLMKKDIPGAGSLAAKIRKVANAKAKTKDPDEFRPAWQAIEKDFKALKKSLSETE